MCRLVNVQETKTLYYLITNVLGHASCALRISGPDAYTYLQGQFTQDLDHPPGLAAYGLWLNQKGRVVADGFVLRLHDNDFIAVSGESPANVVRERLESYLVADEVTISDHTQALGRVAVIDDDGAALRAFGPVPEVGKFLALPGGQVFRGRNARGLNVEYWLETTAIPDLTRRLRDAGAREVEAGLFDAARIEAGRPKVPGDLGPNDLPNEGGIEGDAISYTKGCFLGQEVMARLKNLGQVRRRLHVVRGPGAAPAHGSALFASEKKAGEVRTSAATPDGFVAMAMLALIPLASEKMLARSADGATDIAIAGLAGGAA
ncbi:MAG TPA: folate-binding protein [Candidatus Didemnitutus sp.]|jgi:hypothetical protein